MVWITKIGRKEIGLIIWKFSSCFIRIYLNKNYCAETRKDTDVFTNTIIKFVVRTKKSEALYIKLMTQV